MSFDSSEQEENAEAEDDFEDLYSLWDWPLNAEGVARALETREKFTVSLDFGSLKHSLAVGDFLMTKNCQPRSNLKVL